MRIDRFLVESHIQDLQPCDNRLLIQLADRYKDQLNPSTLRLCLCTFRGFCRFLVRQGCMAEIPLAPLARLKPYSYQPYVFSPAELHRFFDYLDRQAARTVNPLAAYRFRSRYTLYHLLYACGLRVSEAVRLTVADFSPAQSTLFIQPSKFHKDRLIPVGKKVRANLEQLLALPQRPLDISAQGPLFLRLPQRRPYHPHTVSGYFRTVLRRLAIYRSQSIQQDCVYATPHLHQLRRAFAVHRLLKWYREQVDIDAKLPLLATYMGHSRFEHTKTYLTLTQQLLAEAASRFARHFDRLDWLSHDPQLR
jgi:site-specific recombinase XerD